jgi:putative ABC transport system permease protein
LNRLDEPTEGTVYLYGDDYCTLSPRTVRTRDVIEVSLSLGGWLQAVLAPHVRDSVRASLIPVVGSLKSLGWVWIPGIMAGMILAGENPIYAALYQFVIMAMIFSAGGLTSVLSSLLLSREVFSEAEQLRSLPVE